MIHFYTVRSYFHFILCASVCKDTRFSTPSSLCKAQYNYEGKQKKYLLWFCKKNCSSQFHQKSLQTNFWSSQKCSWALPGLINGSRGVSWGHHWNTIGHCHASKGNRSGHNLQHLFFDIFAFFICGSTLRQKAASERKALNELLSSPTRAVAFIFLYEC